MPKLSSREAPVEGGPIAPRPSDLTFDHFIRPLAAAWEPCPADLPGRLAWLNDAPDSNDLLTFPGPGWDDPEAGRDPGGDR